MARGGAGDPALHEGEPGVQQPDSGGQRQRHGQAEAAEFAAAAEDANRDERGHQQGRHGRAAEPGTREPGPERDHGRAARTREQQAKAGCRAKPAAARHDTEQRDSRGHGEHAQAGEHHGDRQRAQHPRPVQADTRPPDHQQRRDHVRGEPRVRRAWPWTGSVLDGGPGERSA